MNEIDWGSLFYLIVFAVWIISIIYSRFKKQEAEKADNLSSKQPDEREFDPQAVPEVGPEVKSLSDLLKQPHEDKIDEPVEEPDLKTKEETVKSKKKSPKTVEPEIISTEESNQDIFDVIVSNNSPLISALIFHEILNPPKSQK